MKKIKRILGLLMMCCMVFSSGVLNVNVFAATVGKALLQPETGWIRFDDRDSNINYVGTWTKATESGFFKSTFTRSKNENDSIQFNFTGTKLRLLGIKYGGYTTNARVEIDGQEKGTFSQQLALVKCSLDFQIEGLQDIEHIVKITFKNDGFYLLDAIDIGEGEMILPYKENIVSGISLDKSVLNILEGDTNTVTAAVYPIGIQNKNIIWSIDDSSIATILTTGVTTNSTNIITGLKAGTTVLRAKTQDGGYETTCTINVSSKANSNVNNAMLTIYLSNQTQRQYDLSANELNAFLNWYDTRATGTGNVRYGFNKPVASSAFTKRTEYVVYDNIVAFDIDEYTSTTK
jgi:hypothetical protein